MRYEYIMNNNYDNFIYFIGFDNKVKKVVPQIKHTKEKSNEKAFQ